MASRKNAAFRSSLFFSILLHGLLLLLLGLGAYTYTTVLSGSRSNSIDAVMVDPGMMAEQNQRLVELKKTKDAGRIAQAKAKDALIEKQKQLELERLKELENKRLKAQQAQIAAAKAKKESIKQYRIQLAKKKAEAEKQHAVAEQEKRAAEAKKEAQTKQVDDILGDLSAKQPAGNENVSPAEFNQFVALVQHAISGQFRNPGIYNGQSCSLHIDIAADGMLLRVSTEDENSALCREAMLAVEQAKLPRPTSAALFEKVKSLTVDFKPGSE